tara:strand:+ start:139 stop:645 length:507 start_codon:yes stop_codon:yes gene_type:complete
MPAITDNKNLLSPIGFKFILTHSPNVDFFSNSVNIPSIDLGTAIQPTYLKDIEVPGDKLQYGDLVVQFLIDEDMENYLEIYKWLMALGYPGTVNQTYDKYNRTYGDATLQILSSNFQVNGQINFEDLFPVSLSGLQFDATAGDIQYLTAEAVFKYKIFTVTNNKKDTY